MHLKLKRSQREGGMLSKTVVFVLDARVDLTAEEASNVKRYKLGKQVIYNSEASKRHLEAGKENLMAGGAVGVAKAWVRLAMMKLSLNITIDSLTHGHHIECKDLDELLGAEQAVVDACKMLRTYLETAATFDGREVVLDDKQLATA